MRSNLIVFLISPRLETVVKYFAATLQNCLQRHCTKYNLFSLCINNGKDTQHLRTPIRMQTKTTERAHCENCTKLGGKDRQGCCLSHHTDRERERDNLRERLLRCGVIKCSEHDDSQWALSCTKMCVCVCVAVI